MPETRTPPCVPQERPALLSVTLDARIHYMERRAPPYGRPPEGSFPEALCVLPSPPSALSGGGDHSTARAYGQLPGEYAKWASVRLRSSRYSNDPQRTLAVPAACRRSGERRRRRGEHRSDHEAPRAVNGRDQVAKSWQTGGDLQNNWV